MIYFVLYYQWSIILIYYIIILYTKNSVNVFIGFTGQMDYLRGDSLNQQVRAAASVSCEIFV